MMLLVGALMLILAAGAFPLRGFQTDVPSAEFSSCNHRRLQWRPIVTAIYCPFVPVPFTPPQRKSSPVPPLRVIPNG